MGLFGGLKKLVGKVVKTGLSVATGGKSDAVLKVVKNVTGIGKPKAKPAMSNADAINALQYTPDVTSGRSTFVALPGLKTYTAKKKKTTTHKVVKKPKAKAAKGYEGEVTKKQAKKTKAQAKKAPKIPKGGLDLKALSASWKAAGKPGTWQGWIKANK